MYFYTIILPQEQFLIHLLRPTWEDDRMVFILELICGSERP